MNLNQLNLRNLIIAGPCALESREQLRACVALLKNLGIKVIRASLWKPRTQPGWEGLGWMSLPMLLEETIPHGMMPATEVINAEHAEMIVEALHQYGDGACMLVWLGSRNQNHLEQKKIAQILSRCPEKVLFMFKNQMWDDEKHWMGIAQHILAAGFPKDHLLICHRGFAPGKLPNPKGLRNLPDYEMAMRVKEKLGLPMLLDPSHIGGSQDNVINICLESKTYAFDGYLIEMHCDPKKARTDTHQQLTACQLASLLEQLNISALPSGAL